jgi:hypothetical protein
VSWTEGDGLKCSPVCLQRQLIFGAAVQIIEHNPGQSISRQPSQVVDIYDSGG